MDTIRPIEPEGLKQTPTRKPQIPELEKVKVQDPSEVRVKVGWFELIIAWIRENLTNDILNSTIKGSAMDSKSWIFSKTIIGNLIILFWSFFGPKIGIPVLPPELMFTLMVAYNLVIRFLTKQPVTIVDELGGNKPWYASKTIWTNFIGAVWLFIGPLVGIPVLSPEVMTQIFDVLNIVLRFFTKQPITLK
jgi:hypothetical protein